VQLPEDGQVRPKRVAADCDFNVMFKGVALKTEVNVKSDTSMQQDAENTILYIEIIYPIRILLVCYPTDYMWLPNKNIYRSVLIS
jgi:hypothetical protein